MTDLPTHISTTKPQGIYCQHPIACYSPFANVCLGEYCDSLAATSMIDEIKHIGADNSLAKIRRQTITWTNDDPVQWRNYVSLSQNEQSHLFWV